MNDRFRLFLKEISRSFRVAYKQYIIAVICLIGCVIYGMNCMNTSDGMSITDILTELFRGNDEKEFYLNDNAIRLPANWIFILAIYYFSVCVFIAKDKSVMLKNTVVRIRNRYIWWNLKYAWLFFYTWAAFLLLVLVIYVSQAVRSGIWSDIFGNNRNICIWAFVLVPVVCFSMASVLMLIQTITNAVTGMGVVIAYLVTTAYIRSPLLLGNFLMFCRTDLYEEGSYISLWLGFVMSVILSAATYAGGIIYMNRKEYIREE